MGKLTISMAILNSYVCLPEGKYCTFVVRFCLWPPVELMKSNLNGLRVAHPQLT